MTELMEGALDAEIVRPKRGRSLRIGAALVGVVFLIFAIFVGTRQTATNNVAYSPLLYKEAPLLSGTSLAGPSISLAQYRGSFVVVNFFASWCVACKSEEPQLKKFLSAEAGRVKILAVDYDDTPALGKSFLAHYGASWQAISDVTGQNAIRWGVDQPPESFLIAPNGKVITKILGAISAPQLERLVQVATAEGY